MPHDQQQVHVIGSRFPSCAIPVENQPSMFGSSLRAAQTTLSLPSNAHRSAQAETHVRELNHERLADSSKSGLRSYSNDLKREYCLFRMKWLPGLLGSDGKPETFKSAQLSFFKSKIPNFDAPKGFDRALRLWWGHREKYLTKQECSICEDVTIAQLTKSISKCQQLESNVGPNTKKQKTMRNEHEIYSADPEATAAHDSRRVRWRASPGRDGEGCDDLDTMVPSSETQSTQSLIRSRYDLRLAFSAFVSSFKVQWHCAID